MLKQIRYHQTTISYKITGSGAPVMLLHGFGEDSHVWEAFASFAQEKFQLILPDLPGTGSSATSPVERITMEYMAACIHHILENEHISSCAVIGHSMGGYVALAFAAVFPEKLNALGLIHSTSYADSPEKIAARKKAIEFIKNNGTKTFLQTTLPGLFHHPERHPQEIAALMEHAASIAPATLVAYYEAMMQRPNRSSIIQSLHCPFAMFLGVHDQAVPFQQSLSQTYLAPLSHVEIFRNSAHMAMFEEKQAFQTKLLHFLESV